MNIQFTPYVLLNGKANEAVDFYAKVFDAEIETREVLKDWYRKNLMEKYLRAMKIMLCMLI